MGGGYVAVDHDAMVNFVPPSCLYCGWGVLGPLYNSFTPPFVYVAFPNDAYLGVIHDSFQATWR